MSQPHVYSNYASTGHPDLKIKKTALLDREEESPLLTTPGLELAVKFHMELSAEPEPVVGGRSGRTNQDYHLPGQAMLLGSPRRLSTADHIAESAALGSWRAGRVSVKIAGHHSCRRFACTVSLFDPTSL
jgi:hypothetical protein